MNLIPSLPKVRIEGAVHYKAPDDHILGRHSMCGINKTVSAIRTDETITCRTCKVLVEHVLTFTLVKSDLEE